eukprot:jgi/Chrzof1/6659/Cz19g04190.t1
MCEWLRVKDMFWYVLVCFVNSCSYDLGSVICNAQIRLQVIYNGKRVHMFQLLRNRCDYDATSKLCYLSN